MESLIELDKALLVFLNSLGNVSFDFIWLIITDKKSSIPLYIFLLIYTYKKLSNHNFLKYLLVVFLLILFTDQISGFFKEYFERLRPCHDINFADLIRIPGNYCGGKYGFFSAHSSNSFALSTFFGFIFLKSNKYILPLLYLFSFLIAYSRIYLGVHFPLDIIFGVFFGVLLGWCFYNFCSWFYKKNTNSIIDF